MFFIRFSLVLLACSLPVLAQAQVLPGPADAARIKPENQPLAVPDSTGSAVRLPAPPVDAAVPVGAETITFTLQSVTIEGSTVYGEAELHPLYAALLGKTITLAQAYTLASRLTDRYRAAGYFLSRAYIPAQEIEEGHLRINVVEGYIGEVAMDDEPGRHGVIQTAIRQLKSHRPLTSRQLESFLLRLNDLPGLGFSGVLSPSVDAPEGAVQLALLSGAKSGKNTVGFDNFSSRFLGPNELSASTSQSFLPLQQTTLSGLSSVPLSKLNYATLNHAVAIAADLTLDLTGAYTHAEPGYRTAIFNVKSDSIFFGTALSYQLIRQRQENLSLKLALDGRNSDTDLLGIPFTRDRVRAVRLSANYDKSDDWHGYNLATATLSQGLPFLGSSEQGDLNLSRAQAVPDFTKAELSLTRLQGIGQDFSLLLSATAQVASAPLYSVEEFGVGGQAFGRAFDASEITGDSGAAGAVELRYDALEDWHSLSLQPYLFYDAGIIWNRDSAQQDEESASSAGLGLRATSSRGISSNAGLAWPIDRKAGTPIYGASPSGPRILLQLGTSF